MKPASKKSQRENRPPSNEYVVKFAQTKTVARNNDDTLQSLNDDSNAADTVYRPVESENQTKFVEFSVRQLKKKEEAVAIAKSDDDEEDFDEMPFLPRKNKPVQKAE